MNDSSAYILLVSMSLFDSHKKLVEDATGRHKQFPNKLLIDWYLIVMCWCLGVAVYVCSHVCT